MTTDRFAESRNTSAGPAVPPQAGPAMSGFPVDTGHANGRRVKDLCRHNKLLASIDMESLAALHRHMERVTLTRGQILIDADAPLTRMWFPETCVVSLVIQMENGSSAEVAAVGCEGAVGHDAVLGMDRSVIRATAQVPGQSLCVATRHLLAGMERSPSLRTAMWHNMAAIHAQAMQSAACYALHPARARLARFLLTIQDRTEQPAMHLTQELLAEILGVQRTTVTAAALALMEQGLILYRRGRIDIRDRPGLEAAACECYHAFRQFLRHAIPPQCRWT